MAYNSLGKEYLLIHQWLVKNYGHSQFCGKCGIFGKDEKGGRWSIHWALKKGFEHKREISHYEGKCRSCHKKYDMTDTILMHLRKLANSQTPTQLAKLANKRRLIALERARGENGAFVANPSQAVKNLWIALNKK